MYLQEKIALSGISRHARLNGTSKVPQASPRTRARLGKLQEHMLEHQIPGHPAITGHAPMQMTLALPQVRLKTWARHIEMTHKHMKPHWGIPGNDRFCCAEEVRKDEAEGKGDGVMPFGVSAEMASDGKPRAVRRGFTDRQLWLAGMTQISDSRNHRVSVL